jgi:c-di-GMP-related signal transduction protein
MEIFVARQPIFDKSKQVVGYELLFRDGVQNCFPLGMGGDEATLQVISSGVSIGFEALTGGKRAFINFTESNITTGLAKLVPEQFLSVEILETVEPTHHIIEACRELRAAGYQIVLDDFVFQARFQPFIEMADIIKIDFMDNNSLLKRSLLRKIIPSRVQLLAEKVETDEDFRQGVELGYTYFQGYFFSRPVVISHKELAPARILQVQLVQAVNSEDFDIGKLEDVIKRDVAFSFKLFKYINSAWFGFRSKIQSIRQAIVLLGQREIRRWVSFMTMRDLSQDKPAELLLIAIIRGRMCEQAAQEAGFPKLAPTAFIVGMFSLLDAMFDRPMEAILPELSLAPEVVEALQGEPTFLGIVLELVRSYEQADWDKLKGLCDTLAIAEERLPVLYQEAVRWADFAAEM